jgi:putative transposase
MVDVRTLPIPESSEELAITLDDLAREGARRMIAAALRAEADEYVARFAEELDGTGIGWWCAMAAPGGAG